MNENEKASQKSLQQKQEKAKKLICNHNASNIYLDLANLLMGYVPSELLVLSYVEVRNFLQTNFVATISYSINVDTDSLDLIATNVVCFDLASLSGRKLP